jgi:hypothetical protein
VRCGRGAARGRIAQTKGFASPDAALVFLDWVDKDIAVK